MEVFDAAQMGNSLQIFSQLLSQNHPSSFKELLWYHPHLWQQLGPTLGIRIMSQHISIVVGSSPM